MRKFLLLLLLLALLITGAYRLDYGPTRNIIARMMDMIAKPDAYILNNKSIALRQSRELVDEAIARGDDLSAGPCLASFVVPGWSLDIVHIPRSEEDDLVKNQCSVFLSGETAHLIEYDEYGNFIQIISQ